MPTVPTGEAFDAFHLTLSDPPKRPVLHGPAGTLITFGLPSSEGPMAWAGVWISPSGPRFLTPVAPATGPAAAHGLSGASAELFDTFAMASRVYLERVEEVDSQLAAIQEAGRKVPLGEVWKLQRHLAVLRAHIGRALVGLAECGGRFSDAFPGFSGASPAATGELVRVQELAQGVRTALSDLILL